MKANEIITSKFLAAIQENKTLPWQKPWRVISQYNAVSGKNYRGINILLLSLFGKDEAFCTFRQAKAAKGNVKSGSKGIPVVFYTQAESSQKDDNGKPKTYRVLRYYTVFNLSDTEGTSLKRKERKDLEFPPVQLAENLIAQATAPISFGGNRACYSPRNHAISLPEIKNFATTEEFYCTMFHEIGHSLARETGKETLDTDMQSESYSKEELVAELFANFCLSFCGIDSTKAFNNSAAYLQNWVSRIGNDPNLIICAASEAQKRFDWIRAKLEPETIETEETIEE